ncbi:MAG: VanZ family protein [Bacilli bacterium]
MKNSKKILNILLIVNFILYLSFLTWTVLFKYVSPLEMLSPERLHERVFHIIHYSDFLNNSFNDIMGSVILYIPLGIFAVYIVRMRKFGQRLFAIFLLSLAFEIFKFIFAIGPSDVFEIICNVLGGLLGIGIYVLLGMMFKNEEKVKSTMAILMTVVMIFVPISMFLMVLRDNN